MQVPTTPPLDLADRTGPVASVGSGARALGFAGLLPPLLATGAIAFVRIAAGGESSVLLGPVVFIAIAYPLLILSFLGGMWWGLAMRRNHGQGRLAALAVMPSLMALVLMGWIAVTGQVGWGLVSIGIAVLLTLPVDRHLATGGEAPAGWMRLRIPLSVGLGGLTILSGALIGAPAAAF